MEPMKSGTLVTVSTGGPAIDGIVVEHPSAHKVVVALVDEKRGPVFRTVAPEALAEREAAGKSDPALNALIRRTPRTGRGGAAGSDGSVHGSRGHARATQHRTTGK